MSDFVQHVYIGLGSNLDDPVKQIKNAIKELKALPKSHYLKDSGLYLSKAMQLPEDDSKQPDYYNAVALLATELDPLELLGYLQSIERRHGRVRTVKWASRTLDLDILLFGELQINTEKLQIPHPGLCEREFVLYPLQNIEQALDIPGHGKLKECIEKCSRNGLRYLGPIGGAE